MAQPAEKPQGTPRVLVFDLDGTLIDSAPDLAQAVNAMLDELGKPPLPEARVRTMIGDGSRLLLRRALEASGADASPDVFEQTFQRFMTFYLHYIDDRTRLYDGVLETLERLQARGYPMGICTNKPIAPTRRVLEAFGLAPFFSSVIGGDSLPQRKPDPAPLRAVIAELGSGPAAMIGDSAADMLCARAAGVIGILIPSDYGQPAQDADLKLKEFSELTAILEAL